LSSNRFQKLAAQLGFKASKSPDPTSTADLLSKALQDMDAAESQSAAREAFQKATDALAAEETVSFFLRLGMRLQDFSLV
jgi:hypothetical protein